MSLTAASTKKTLNNIIDQVMIEGAEELDKLEYLTLEQSREICEIMVTAIVRPYIRQYNADQLQLFKPKDLDK
jgi:hypothetical protein